MSRWILQCNLNYYNWFEFINYMKENKISLDTWFINPDRHKNTINKVSKDDTAFIWLTTNTYLKRKTRGIWAIGKIKELLSHDIKEFNYESTFYRETKEAIDARERFRHLPRIKFEYDFSLTDKLISKPLLKEELEQIGIDDLTIIKRPRGTNICEMPEYYFQIIIKLVNNR